MEDKKTLKRELDKQVDQLPEDQLREVLDFVGYLLQHTETHPPKPAQPIPPEQDPILDLIGMVDVKPFAHNIDGELYGA